MAHDRLINRTNVAGDVALETAKTVDQGRGGGEAPGGKY